MSTVRTASVVILARNQRPFLERSLAALAAQRGVTSDYEVIVVDSGSTDGTAELVQFWGARLIASPRPFCYGAAYNVGAAEASGEFLVRLSGDAVPATDTWLASLLAPLQSDPTVAASWGRQILPSGLRNPLEHLADRLYYNTDRHGDTPRRFTRPHNVLGSSMALRRALWETQPFSESLPQAEDYAWLRFWQQHGYAGVYVPKAAILHGHEEPLVRALRRVCAQSALQGYILARSALALPV